MRKFAKKQKKAKRRSLSKLNLNIIRLTMIQANLNKRGFRNSIILYKIIRKRVINEKEKKGMV